MAWLPLQKKPIMLILIRNKIIIFSLLFSDQISSLSPWLGGPVLNMILRPATYNITTIMSTIFWWECFKLLRFCCIFCFIFRQANWCCVHCLAGLNIVFSQFFNSVQFVYLLAYNWMYKSILLKYKRSVGKTDSRSLEKPYIRPS